MLVILPPLPSVGTFLYFIKGFMIIGALALAGLFIFRFFESYTAVLQTGVWWMVIPMLALTVLVIRLAFKKRFWFAGAALIPLIAVNFYVQSAWQGQVADADAANARAASYVEAITSSFRGFSSIAPIEIREFAQSLEWLRDDFSGPPEREQRAYGHDVVYGMTNDLGMGNRLAWPQGTGSQGFLDAYEPLRQEHGDWLGFIADCELRLPRVVPGGFCASAGGILESYGVDIKAQLDRHMADRGGIAACADDLVCGLYHRRYRDLREN